MCRQAISRAARGICLCIGSLSAGRGWSQEMDGLYDCRVVQIRYAPTCNVPRPVCADALGPFQMQITGDQVEWVDCFSCVGTWTKGDFYCDLDPGVTTAGPGGEPCPSEPWVVLQQDPNPERPLEPGEVYAGIPVSNAFNAHCAPSAGNSPSDSR